MSKQTRSYSRYVIEALLLLGREVEYGRKQKKITAQSLAERCGISRPTLRKIERGDPTVEIGVVFEAATIVGIELFNSPTLQNIAGKNALKAEHVALLPTRVRKKAMKESDDAF